MPMHEDVTITGISAAVPECVFRIADYPHFSPDECRGFIKHVGVQQKRYSRNLLTAADLCESACRQLLNGMDWSPESVGALVFVSQSADHLIPSTSIILQHRLGLRTDTLAFDIRLGCSGWVYGLSVVRALMSSLKIRRGLLLAGETSVLTLFEDASHFPLMGDAGTATAVEMTKGAEPMVFQFYSDGSRSEAIHAPNSGARHFADGGMESDMRYRARMDADQVLRFCLRDVVQSIRSFMEKHRADSENVDFFVFHQANRLINEAMRKKLNIPEEKFPYSIGRFGNTSSASIPLTIITQLREQMAREKRLLCSGFGVGLSMAHVLLKVDNLMCLPLIEVPVPGP